MSIKHRFIDELESIEQSQMFCGESISQKCNLLIIGTFNPDNKSYNGKDENNATWFYGREKNYFWKYLPECLIGKSLHIKQGFSKKDWELFCIENKIVIVDLIKEIKHDSKLEDFKDKRLNDRINDSMDNVIVFDFKSAFKNIKFEKVIYSRKGWCSGRDSDISKLIHIKCKVNDILLGNKIINDLNQIKYCPSPWQQRQTTQSQWNEAINT